MKCYYRLLHCILESFPICCELLEIVHLVLGYISAGSVCLIQVKPWVVSPPVNKMVDSSFFPHPEKKEIRVIQLRWRMKIDNWVQQYRLAMTLMRRDDRVQGTTRPYSRTCWKNLKDEDMTASKNRTHMVLTGRERVKGTLGARRSDNRLNTWKNESTSGVIPLCGWERRGCGVWAKTLPLSRARTGCKDRHRWMGKCNQNFSSQCFSFSLLEESRSLTVNTAEGAVSGAWRNRKINEIRSQQQDRLSLGLWVIYERSLIVHPLNNSLLPVLLLCDF